MKVLISLSGRTQAWFDKLPKRDKMQYLTDHPKSKFGKKTVKTVAKPATKTVKKVAKPLVKKIAAKSGPALRDDLAKHTLTGEFKRSRGDIVDNLGLEFAGHESHYADVHVKDMKAFQTDLEKQGFRKNNAIGMWENKKTGDKVDISTRPSKVKFRGNDEAAFEVSFINRK